MKTYTVGKKNEEPGINNGCSSKGTPSENPGQKLS